MKNFSEKSLSSNCDTNFNDRSKALFETFLAKLVVINYIHLFFPIILQVSCFIAPDFQKVLKEIKSNQLSEISKKFIKHLFMFEDFRALYTLKAVQPALEKFIADLESIHGNSWYRKMAIQRAYVLFFIKTDKQECFDEANKTKWSHVLNLDKLLNDVLESRRGKFCDRYRVDRAQGPAKKNTRIGIIDSETFHHLSPSEIRSLTVFPPHTKGMSLFRVTTAGEFTQDGLHKYNMPALCGPSGMTALRLAIGLQADLSPTDLRLYFFFICIFTIAVGGHTFDETFSMGINGATKYQRGDYLSGIPNELKTHKGFMRTVHKLQKRYLQTDSSKDSGMRPRAA
jgi:hypothetical protein